VSTYYFKWWPPILGAVLVVYHFLGERTPIFNWLLGLFILIARLLLAIIVVAIVRQKRAQTWRSYTKDTVDGLVWRWTYSSAGPIDLLSAYCPHCDFQLPKHARYFILQLAESPLTSRLFGQILSRITRLAWHPT
jgi:hypothetical protein